MYKNANKILVRTAVFIFVCHLPVVDGRMCVSLHSCPVAVVVVMVEQLASPECFSFL